MRRRLGADSELALPRKPPALATGRKRVWAATAAAAAALNGRAREFASWHSLAPKSQVDNGTVVRLAGWLAGERADATSGRRGWRASELVKAQLQTREKW